MATVKIGSKIKKDILSKVGALLIPANSVLRKEDFEKLAKHRIDLREIEITSSEHKDTDEPERAPNPDMISKFETQLIERATDRVKDIFESIRQTSRIPLMEVKKNIVPIIQKTAENRNLYKLLNALKAKDHNTHRHSINVAVLATLIGRWMNLEESELFILTTAATLHDVGKMKIPTDILSRQGELNAEEDAILKKHTILGYEMLKNTTGTSHRLALVALQHHEREDGSGYPLGLKADKIDVLSKIIAIADLFLMITADGKREHKGESFIQIIRKIQGGFFGELNLEIVYLLLHKMMESMMGNEAVLSDGRQCKIIMVNPYDPLNPLVCIDDEFIDLSKESSLQLIEVLG